MNGTVLKGKLHTKPGSPYEVMLKTKDGRILIFKHAICSIQEVQGGESGGEKS